MSSLLGLFKDRKKPSLMPTLKRIDTVKAGNIDVEDIYLKIDDKNYLEQYDEYYISNIEVKFQEYKEKETEKRESIEKIMKAFLDKIASKYDDTFTFSQKIAKLISKNQKIEKDLLETQLNTLLNKTNKSKNNIYRSNILNLNLNICKPFGIILSYAYSKMSNYKIKDISKLIEIRKKIIRDKIDILKDFQKYCKNNNKNPQNEMLTKYCKDNRTNYECLPELIFLINRYCNVNTILVDINSFTILKEDELPYFEITILNIYWLLNSLNTIKFHFIPEEFEKSLLNIYNEKLDELLKKHEKTSKINSLINNYTLYKNKWNFVDNFKNNYYREAMNVCSNFVSHKSFDLSSNSNRMAASKTVVSMKRNTFMDLSFLKRKENDDDGQSRKAIINKNLNILEFILISLFSLNNTEYNFHFELIANDCLIKEFLITFKEIYEMEWIEDKDHSQFHILDLILYNNIMERIEKFNIEINTLDPFTFDKLLHFLYYNHTMTSFNLSLFSADVTYLTPFLHKIFRGMFNNKLLFNDMEDCTYLFNDVKDIEEKMISHLSVPFIYHLSILFHIIKKKKNLNELGFNFDIPFNILNKQNYMNAIFKFILNILFYVSNTRIKKFCLLSPNNILDCRSDPEINRLINGLNINNNPFIEEFSLQMQFYKIININAFVSPKLKILNIGDLDLISFKSLCNYICSYNFNKNSSLERLSISLINSITNFTFDLKILFEKLFKIKIKNFISLNIFTNIEFIDKYQYLYLLKILDNNWISEYRITFNRNSHIIINQNQNGIKKLQYLVPHSLEEKLLEDEDLMKIKKNPKSDVLQYVNKNIDKYDEIYWYLKYLLTKVYTDNLKNEERTKQIIFDILKYVYFVKTPKIHHTNVSKNI